MSYKKDHKTKEKKLKLNVDIDNKTYDLCKSLRGLSVKPKNKIKKNDYLYFFTITINDLTIKQKRDDLLIYVYNTLTQLKYNFICVIDQDHTTGSLSENKEFIKLTTQTFLIITNEPYIERYRCEVNKKILECNHNKECKITLEYKLYCANSLHYIKEYINSQSMEKYDDLSNCIFNDNFKQMTKHDFALLKHALKLHAMK
jgi:hypothetical protein